MSIGLRGVIKSQLLLVESLALHEIM